MLLALLEWFLAVVANMALVLWLSDPTAEHDAIPELASAEETFGTSDDTVKPTAPAMALEQPWTADANAAVESKPPGARDVLAANVKVLEAVPQQLAMETAADSAAPAAVNREPDPI